MAIKRPPDFSNFILPGCRDREGGLQHLMIAMSHAYSMTNNPRNLECYFYGPWGDVLRDLIQDIGPEILVIPQHRIYPFHRNAILHRKKVMQDERDRQATLERQRREHMRGREQAGAETNAENPLPQTSAAHLEPQWDGSEPDPAQESIAERDPGNTSFETVPDEDAEELVADFAIITILEFFRRGVQPKKRITIENFPDKLSDWDGVRVGRSRVDLVAEIKSALSRHLFNRPTFQRTLFVEMMAAREQAVYQAERAFKSDASLETVLALACIGEWWCWVVVTRDILPVLIKNAREDGPSTREEKVAAAKAFAQKLKAHKVLESDDSEYDPGISAGPPTAGPSLRVRTNSQIRYKELSDDEITKFTINEVTPYRRHLTAPVPSPESLKKKEEPAKRLIKTRLVPKDLLHSRMEIIHDNIFDAIPDKAQWSRYLRLGMGPSNQALYLLHYFLQHRKFPKRNGAAPSTTNRRPRSDSTLTTEDNPHKRQRQKIDSSVDHSTEEGDGAEGTGCGQIKMQVDPNDSEFWDSEGSFQGQEDDDDYHNSSQFSPAVDQSSPGDIPEQLINIDNFAESIVGMFSDDDNDADNEDDREGENQ